MRSKPTAADRPSGTAPEVHLTAACETGRCAPICRGQVFSLLYVGPCECGCHRQEVAA